MTLEYRAFPLSLDAYDPRPLPLYEWVRTLDAGAVVEWPLGHPYDAEPMLRQAEHGKPLVNGHQSFIPPAYAHLVAHTHETPIPETVWGEMARLGADLVVFHPDRGRPDERVRYRRLLRGGILEGRLRLLPSFRDTEGESFVLRLSTARSEAAARDDSVTLASRRELDVVLAVSDAELAPPFGAIDFPEPVKAGQWCWGWALDDSGIAAVEIATEAGPAGAAQIGLRRPDLPPVFPDFAGAAHAGFGFLVPPLASGAHVLNFTLIATDGGRTVLRRPIVAR